MNEFEASLNYWKNVWINNEREGCKVGHFKCPRCKNKESKQIVMIWNEKEQRAECPECGWNRTTKSK